jgi:hypothetical protein
MKRLNKQKKLDLLFSVRVILLILLHTPFKNTFSLSRNLGFRKMGLYKISR